MKRCRTADLPEEVLIDILSRLSIKTIVTCRCVSKTWRDLLSSSNPQFTKLHFNRSPVQFILQTGVDPNVLFHIVEVEDDTDLNNSIKPLPSRFRPSKSDLYAVNSCNGFLCLATSSFQPSRARVYNKIVKVCNPITGEYLNLPNHKRDDYRCVASGFGCSAKTNQYKVVKLVYRRECNPHFGYRNGDGMALVYTIGTKSWRNVTAPKFLNQLGSTTFFNGAIHWVCYDNCFSDFIISFDLESEKFGVVPPPPDFSTETIRERHHINIGVIGEFLYISYNMELWVMKEYGVQESWDEVCVVDRPVNSHQAIKFLSGGKILMNYGCIKLISYDPAEKICKEYTHTQLRAWFKTIAHVPSFMSFDDAMMGDKGAKLRTRMCRVRGEKRY